MLGVARALIADPQLLILDEPSAGLAPAVVEEVFARVKAINAAGVSILMVEQKARQCLALADYGYVLDMGRNRIEGTGQQLLTDRAVIDAYLGSRGRLDLAATEAAVAPQSNEGGPSGSVIEWRRSAAGGASPPDRAAALALPAPSPVPR